MYEQRSAAAPRQIHWSSIANSCVTVPLLPASPPTHSPITPTHQHTQIHWFSIANSCVTVLLLTGFLGTILMRVLKADFAKYTSDEEGA